MNLQARLAAALEGRYTLLERIGQGGMATVYLAEDVRHERRVALKVLRPELAAVVGAERFLGEIKTTANLQHPHILPLHDSGEAGGSVFYVMPYVEGETLRDRLERERQLPVEDAVRTAREILGALDYAHRHGVIHRDIKPENILLHDRQAMVADFGVALAVSTAGAEGRMTETGMSLGTPSYMSPEQAMGEREISARSDVYAVGCVLYEMLLGEPPFSGPTPQAVVARVITEEPRPMAGQRKTVPPHVEAAVMKALAKLPADRFRSAADFADALARPERLVAAPASSGTTPSAPAPSWRHPLVLGSLAVAAAAVAGAGWALGLERPADSAPPVRFEIGYPEGYRLEAAQRPLAISPDGRTVAVLAHQGDDTRVYVRELGEMDVRAVPGTEDASSVTFTEDGNWITFARGAALYKVPVAGGTPTRVAAVPWNMATASYFPDGSIMVGSSSDNSVYRLAREGAELEEMTRADPTRGELTHRRPTALPDGKHVLFEVLHEDGYHPAVLSLSSGEWTDLGLGVAPDPVYSAGRIVYAQANRVLAVPIDPESGRVTGTPTVVDGVSATGDDPARIWALAASPDGTLVHASGPGGPNDVDLIWVDRDGTVTETGIPRGEYDQPRLSPDAQRVAVQRYMGALDVLRVGTGQRTRLAPPQAQLPEWEPPDGRAIAFGDGGTGLWLVASDGSTPPERIVDAGVWPYSWSPDGRTLGIYGVSEETARDILLAHRGDDGTWTTSSFLATDANERSPAISPDGRWIAYVSDESGQDEIYVRSFPSGESPRLVSRGGGREPAWSRGGREIVYRLGRDIYAVPLGDGADLDPGAPVRLFSVDATMTEGPTGERDWDVTEDGRRFLFARSPRTVSPFTLRVVMNFAASG